MNVEQVVADAKKLMADNGWEWRRALAEAASNHDRPHEVFGAAKDAQ